MKTPKPSALFAALLLALSPLAQADTEPAAPAAAAQQGAAPDSGNTLEARIETLLKQAENGPKTIELGRQATLKLPEGMRFLPKAPADELMKMVGNSALNGRYGLILPADENREWMADLAYLDSGYIKDDDAKSWNPDAMLKEIKKAVAEQNKERAKQGIPPLEVKGWAERPYYDAAAHRLVFSLDGRLQGSDTGNVNYNTFALGRHGFISLTMAMPAGALEREKATAQTLLAAIEYKEGERYTDYNPKTDKTADYGLAALVGGGLLAKKLGLFALIAAFVAKFAKVLVVAAGAAVYAVRRFFGGSRRRGGRDDG